MIPRRHSVIIMSLLMLAGCPGCSVLGGGGTGTPAQSSPHGKPSPEASAPQSDNERAGGAPRKAATPERENQGQGKAPKEQPAETSGGNNPESSAASAGESDSTPRSISLSPGRRSLTRALSNATRQLKNRSREVERLRSKVTELEKKIEGKKQKIEGLQKQLKQRESRIEKLKKGLKKWKKDVIGFRNEMRSAEEAEMQALKQVIALMRR